MRLIRTLSTLAALLALTPPIFAQPRPAPAVGQAHLITKSYETSQAGDDGSSGSSSGASALLERVIGARDGGLELEYDLPHGATAEDRAREWQFPVRVFRPPAGPLQLLNQGELQARADRWLTTAGLPRSACGRHYFTWTAFRVECDPQSAIQLVEAFELRAADLRDGAPFGEPGALGPGTLTATGRDGAAFSVSLHVDPDAVRRARAEADVVVGEIMNQPVTLAAALRERAKERVSGTISITFDTDGAGNVHRRTKTTRLKIIGPDGRSETETATETLTRRPAPAPPAPD